MDHLRVERAAAVRMFPFAGQAVLPKDLYYLSDSKDYTADVDVLISTVGDMRHIAELVRNYQALEKKLKIHIWLAFAETDFLAFARAPQGDGITRVMLLNNPVPWLRITRNPLVWSISAALCAQAGIYFGRAPYFFYSHEDMMALKENFLTFLRLKINPGRPMASFFQRHLIPHSGGMMIRKDFFQNEGVDFLPLKDNPFSVSGLNVFEARVPSVKWVDAGEQYVYRALEKKAHMYICECHGGKHGPLNDPVEMWQVKRSEVHAAEWNVDYAPCKAKTAVVNDNGFSPLWWQAFDDAGEPIFMHRARGSAQRMSTDNGDFCRYLREFNRQHHII